MQFLPYCLPCANYLLYDFLYNLFSFHFILRHHVFSANLDRCDLFKNLCKLMLLLFATILKNLSNCVKKQIHLGKDFCFVLIKKKIKIIMIILKVINLRHKDRFSHSLYYKILKLLKYLILKDFIPLSLSASFSPFILNNFCLSRRKSWQRNYQIKKFFNDETQKRMVNTILNDS